MDFSNIGRMFTPSISQRCSGAQNSPAEGVKRARLVPENKPKVQAAHDIAALVENQRKVQQEIKETERFQMRLSRIPEELREAMSKSDIIDASSKSTLKNRFQKNDKKIISDVAKDTILAEIKKVKLNIRHIANELAKQNQSVNDKDQRNKFMPKRRDEEKTKQLLNE